MGNIHELKLEQFCTKSSRRFVSERCYLMFSCMSEGKSCKAKKSKPSNVDMGARHSRHKTPGPLHLLPACL